MGAFGVCFILLIAALLWRLVVALYWRPRSLLAQLNRQGIWGPSPLGFMEGGNMMEIIRMRGALRHHDMKSFTHNIVERILPDHVKWSKQFGKRYVFLWGTEPRMTITEPELIREILSKKVPLFWKSEDQVSIIRATVGRGLLAVTGDEWAHHRRIVAPAFYFEKLKTMTGVMASSTTSMLEQWETMTEVEVHGEMNKLTADIISRTAFGSSYLSGQKVFGILKDKLPLQALKFSMHLAWIPGARYIPLVSPAAFKLRKFHKEMDTTIASIIDQRRKSNSYGNDLLGLMLKECEGDSNFRLLSWSLMLLAGYPEWQERARAEVLETCGDKFTVPEGDMLNKLKLVGMVLHEALRLYPSAHVMERECLQDTWLNDDIFVPKGVTVSIPIIAIHHDKELWGEDADEFNPERFKDGITSACKHPNAYMPFSFGPRVCIGQSFALIEAKVVLALILQRFSLRLSPNYRHNPASTSLGFKPVHGIHLILNNF